MSCFFMTRSPTTKIYTLSYTTLFRSRVIHIHVAEQPAELKACFAEHGLHPIDLLDEVGLAQRATAVHAIHLDESHARKLRDRKSTRLNSSHQIISYAVFCLKKKKRAH